MTGSMYAAVSGMKAHMNKLNVIGNNIANVNTYGYKAGRVTFTESLYTTMKGGSNGTTEVGGVNPSQIGYGVQIGSIDLDMTAKNYMPTGLPTDCMLDADGFFLVGDKTGGLTSANANALSLSRVGDFFFDSSGYLVDRRGNVVHGFLSASAGATGGTAADYNTDPATGNPLNADQSKGISTELAPIRLPLAAVAAAAAPPAAAVKAGAAVYPGVDATGATVDATTGVNADGKRVQLTGISIDETGRITGINKDTDEPVVVGYIAIASVDNPYGVTHTSGPYYKALGGAGDLRVSSMGSAVKGYLNNKTAANSTTLDRIQGGGDGKIISGGLESSGTDLASEITEMITTQRGYQANTRIITVTDAMLEELVNIKR